MQVTQVLELWDASIRDARLRMKNGAFSVRVNINAQLTPDLAAVLGCRDLIFLKNGVPREGVPDDQSWDGPLCPSFHGLLSVDGLRQEIQINGDSVTDLTVIRSSKEGMRLEVTLNYSGDPLTFIAYWKEVGAAPGICKIRPLQQDLDAADNVSAELLVKTPSGTISMPIEGDTLRSAARAATAGGSGKQEKTTKHKKGSLVN
jgi:hypothetical protein